MSSSARARRPRRLRLALVIVSGPSAEICGRVGAAITSGPGRASGTDVPWAGAAIGVADTGSGARITSDGGCDLRAWPRADQLDLLREGGAVATDSRALPRRGAKRRASMSKAATSQSSQAARPSIVSIVSGAEDERGKLGRPG